VSVRVSSLPPGISTAIVARAVLFWALSSSIAALSVQTLPCSLLAAQVPSPGLASWKSAALLTMIRWSTATPLGSPGFAMKFWLAPAPLSSALPIECSAVPVDRVGVQRRARWGPCRRHCRGFDELRFDRRAGEAHRPIAPVTSLAFGDFVRPERCSESAAIPLMNPSSFPGPSLMNSDFDFRRR